MNSTLIRQGVNGNCNKIVRLRDIVARAMGLEAFLVFIGLLVDIAGRLSS